MDAPTGPDQLSAAFKTALTSPGGAAVEAQGTPGTKSVSVISANQALTNYNNMGTFASQQQATNAQQAAVNAANKAAADQAAATKTQTDASTTSNNNLAGAITSAAGALNGTTGTTGTTTPTPAKAGDTLTTASGNTYTSTGNPTADVLAGNNADVTAQLKTSQAALATAATTAGLSPEQQTQISSLGSQYDSLITQQTQANAMTQGQNSMALARSGADRYGTATALSVMTSVINTGIASIADLTSKKNAALAQMTSGFESDNVKAVQSAYDDWTKANDTLTANLKEINTVLSDAQTAQAQAAKDYQAQQKDARDFAFTNNIQQPYYKVGNEIRSTADGSVVTGVDPSQVQTIDPGSKAEADYVKHLSETYGDTVFPTMTAEQAQKAMTYSAKYKTDNRLPEWMVNGSGSGKVKFTSDQSNRLLAANLTNDQVSAIQTNLNNGYGIDEILKSFGLSDSQNKTVKDVMGGVTASQSSQPQDTYRQVKDYNAWIWQNFSAADVSKAAHGAGFKDDKTKGKAVDQYLASIQNVVKPGISANNSDQDIMTAVSTKINADLAK